MKVKPPFTVYPNSWVLAALVLVRVRVFSKAHPDGKVNLAPIYQQCQTLSRY